MVAYKSDYVRFFNVYQAVERALFGFYNAPKNLVSRTNDKKMDISVDGKKNCSQLSPISPKMVLCIKGDIEWLIGHPNR